MFVLLSLKFSAFSSWCHAIFLLVRFVRVVSGKAAEIVEHEPDADDDDLLQWLSMAHTQGGVLQTALGMPHPKVPPARHSDRSL